MPTQPVAVPFGNHDWLRSHHRTGRSCAGASSLSTSERRGRVLAYQAAACATVWGKHKRRVPQNLWEVPAGSEVSRRCTERVRVEQCAGREMEKRRHNGHGAAGDAQCRGLPSEDGRGFSASLITMGTASLEMVLSLYRRQPHDGNLQHVGLYSGKHDVRGHGQRCSPHQRVRGSAPPGIGAPHKARGTTHDKHRTARENLSTAGGRHHHVEVILEVGALCHGVCLTTICSFTRKWRHDNGDSHTSRPPSARRPASGSMKTEAPDHAGAVGHAPVRAERSLARPPQTTRTPELFTQSNQMSAARTSPWKPVPACVERHVGSREEPVPSRDGPTKVETPGAHGIAGQPGARCRRRVDGLDGRDLDVHAMGRQASAATQPSPVIAHAGARITAFCTSSGASAPGQ